MFSTLPKSLDRFLSGAVGMLVGSFCTLLPATAFNINDSLWNSVMWPFHILSATITRLRTRPSAASLSHEEVILASVRISVSYMASICWYYTNVILEWVTSLRHHQNVHLMKVHFLLVLLHCHSRLDELPSAVAHQSNILSHFLGANHSKKNIPKCLKEYVWICTKSLVSVLSWGFSLGWRQLK